MCRSPYCPECAPDVETLADRVETILHWTLDPAVRQLIVDLAAARTLP